MKIGLPEMLKYLRNEAGITQRELAKATGLSLASIVSYENGMRQPNSKAMAALESYFDVTGEYLRGDTDRNTFFEYKNKLEAGFDDVHVLTKMYGDAMLFSSQKMQTLSLTLLKEVFNYLINDVLPENVQFETSEEDIVQFFNVIKKLNNEGRTELLKRADELSQIKKYTQI